VEERDAISDFLAGKHDQDVLLVGCPDPEAIQLKVVGEQDFQVLERQEESVVQVLGHEPVKLLGQSDLDAFRSACLGLNQAFELGVANPVEQRAIDIDRVAKAFATRRACPRKSIFSYRSRRS
jgi:hypothetical protein